MDSTKGIVYSTHKTKSVQEILEYQDIREFSVIPSDKEIDEMVKLAEARANDKALRKKIKNRCKYLSEETKKQKEVLK